VLSARCVFERVLHILYETNTRALCAFYYYRARSLRDSEHAADARGIGGVGETPRSPRRVAGTRSEKDNGAHDGAGERCRSLPSAATSGSAGSRAAM
jgi:hypothetical protein